MKKIYAIVLAVLAFCAFSAQQQQPKQAAGCELVQRALRDTATIKPGSHRRDVEKLFNVAGGLNTRLDTYYLFRDCSYIGVKVTFTADPSVKQEFSADDVVTAVSQLYLTYPAMD